MIAAVEPGLSGTTLGGLAVIVSAMGWFLWRQQKASTEQTNTFMNAIESQREGFTQALEDQRTQFTETIGEHRRETNIWLNNHLSGYTRELDRLVTAVDTLTKEIRDGHQQ